MSELSSHNVEGVGFTDSGLLITPAFIENLEAVGLENLAAYYRVIYRLAF